MVTLICSILAMASGGGRFGTSNESLISKLVAASKDGLSLMETQELQTIQLGPAETETAETYIRSHDDYTSYALLFALQRSAPQIHKHIPGAIRASVLCSALAHLRYMNDWGYLDPSEPFDGEAAKALIETGLASIDCIHPLLNDGRPAPLFGTEEATMSSAYRYRRKDFAYRYLSLILGRKPSFDPRPDVRDKDIERLRASLEGESQV